MTNGKVCFSCGILKLIWKNHDGNKYCKPCWLKAHPNKLNPISKSHRQTLNEYKRIRATFMQDKVCEACLEGCTVEATEVHHMMGKVNKELWLDTSKWLPVCRTCHLIIENQPTLAKELGLSLNRLE